APAYGATVPPPGTGMIGQPAPYNGYVSSPQGAAYPPAPVMPGPTGGWQGTAPAAPAAPAPNTWSWSQTGTPTAPPSLQQYGNQANNQVQQYANQMQAQPQQWANSTQQAIANQQQQLSNQMQATANQYQQGLNNQVNQYGNQMQQNLQQQQQQLTGQMQQAFPQQQTANGNWWPFQSPNSVPPARATPTAAPKY
ncbi:MAG: hypothetical protein EBR28_11135, partial [Planctomycetia bacterium]|nr:hypothetical protein [Planctomycetia bacterium]